MHRCCCCVQVRRSRRPTGRNVTTQHCRGRAGRASLAGANLASRSETGYRFAFDPSRGGSVTQPLPDGEPRVASMVFRDFDEFSAMNGVLDIEFLQLASAPVDSRMLRVVLDRMVLMR